MPKLKTHRGASKRFKITKNGKVRRNKAFGRHLMSAKSPKRRRNLRKGTISSPEDDRRVKRLLPYA